MTLPTTLELDEYGYPPDEWLASIRDARPTMAEAAQWMRETLPDLVGKVGYGRVAFDTYSTPTGPVHELRIATGGWSGMEDFLSAVMSNVALAYYWQSTHRGGLYVFQVPVGGEA